MSAYETVIGLEVHAELATASKIFCGCSTRFGAKPNTQCCPVCLGLPGALPVLNRKVVELAVKAGLALGCEIEPYSVEDRKNYFYPDLPKAYQISQFDRPLCKNGEVRLSGGKRIGITRIHIEEDAGKLIHTEDGTLCDYNRCGVPLIEIVSEPELCSPEEAAEYLRKLRAILLFAGVSDCRMQEGSFRCDVNLSVRRPGEPLGVRTEIKNLNSVQFVLKATAFESARQAELLESGGRVLQETRRFDAASGKTLPMRTKETADDYRFFPDPDLPPIRLSKAQIGQWRSEIPELPDSRRSRYMTKYGLPAQDAELIVSDPETAAYYEKAAGHGDPVATARLLVGELFRLRGAEEGSLPVPPEYLGRLAQLFRDGRINSSTAKRVLGQLWVRPEPPEDCIERQGWWQINDPEALRETARKAVETNPRAAAQYRKGKTNAIQALVGQCMGMTNGLANPETLLESLLELLREQSGEM